MCENLESETKLGRIKKESMHLIQFHQTNSNANKILSRKPSHNSTISQAAEILNFIEKNKRIKHICFNIEM